MLDRTYRPQIDQAVIRDTSLTALTRLVYVALTIFADRKTGECRPSQKTIGDIIGIKERAVRNHLQALVDAGYVEVVKRRRQNSTILRLIGSRPAPPCRSKAVKTGTVAHQDRHGDDIKTGTTVPPNRSKNKSKNNGAPADADSRLLELVDGWNDLGPDIAKGVQRDPMSKAILKGWARLSREPELRDAFKDIPAMLAAIQRATFCHGQGWFTLAWLFGANRDGEHKAIKLLSGAYASPSGNGRHAADELKPLTAPAESKP